MKTHFVQRNIKIFAWLLKKIMEATRQSGTFGVERNTASLEFHI
jgi:hypothetical protein